MAVGIGAARHAVIPMRGNVLSACHCACIRTVRRTALGAAVQRAGNRLVVPLLLRNRVSFDMRAAEGEIKGRSTPVCAKPVCTWGWRGTRRIRHRAAEMREAACFLAYGRASYAVKCPTESRP